VGVSQKGEDDRSSVSEGRRIAWPTLSVMSQSLDLLCTFTPSCGANIDQPVFGQRCLQDMEHMIHVDNVIAHATEKYGHAWYNTLYSVLQRHLVAALGPYLTSMTLSC
jgi:hypothetical protein